MAKTTDTYLAQFWRLEAQDEGASRSIPGEGSLPGLQTATFTPSPVSSCGRQQVSSLVSSHGGTNPIMTSSKPNRPKGLVSTISLQVGPQQMDLGGTHTFSP